MTTYFWILLKTKEHVLELGPYVEYRDAKLIVSEHYELLEQLVPEPLIVLSIEERALEKQWITINTKLEVQFDNRNIIRAISE